MLAAIDVGSNTIRMLLGDVIRGKVQPLRYERRITRLKGGQTDKGLAPASMERTFVALRQFKKIAEEYNPDNIRIVGTEALRSAPDGEEFRSYVQQNIGLDLEIISGEEEGVLSSAGVLSVLEPSPKNAVIVDIGGGSTEIIVTSHNKLLFQQSCSLGVVSLAEIGSKQEQQQLINVNMASITDKLSNQKLLEFVRNPATLFIGTAGTITTLAALDLEMTAYDWKQVNNYKISGERVDYFLNHLGALSLPEREKIPGMEKGRGDLIVPGLSILQKLMNLLSKNELIISDFGLLEGLFLQMSD